jgi:hypothetical protein
MALQDRLSNGRRILWKPDRMQFGTKMAEEIAKFEISNSGY